MQVEAGESKLLLFETFSLFFFLIFPGRVIEELAFLKIKDKETHGGQTKLQWVRKMEKMGWRNAEKHTH